MKKKNVVLSIIFVFLLVIIILIVGLNLYVINLIAKKEVLSDYAIRSQIESLFAVDLPENAHHLYYAHNRTFFIDHFAAFTLQSKEECESLLAEMNCPLNDFIKKIRCRIAISRVDLKAGSRNIPMVTGNCQMRQIS